MKCFRLGVMFLYVIPFCYPQEGKVYVVNSAARELKRTAHRLLMPVEQLRNARKALDEATELTRQLEWAPGDHLGNLARLWIDINHPKAATALESLLESVRRTAIAANGLEPYQACADRAKELIPFLALVDVDKALQTMRQWPAAPLSSGPAGEKVRRDLESRCRAQIVRELSFRDPGRAIALAEEMGPDSSELLAARAGQIQSMTRLGQREQALELADRSIAEFKQGNENLNDYLIFLRSLANLDQDRFLMALAPIAGSFSGAPLTRPAYYVGELGIPVTRMEMMVLGMLRSRPELMLKAVDMIPGLKTKADQAGGVDKLLTGRRSGKPPQAKSPQVSAGTGARSASADTLPPTDADSLYEELRGKAEKDTGYVRARLSEVARDPGQIDMLISLADTARYEDPELGSLAMDAARPLLARLEPPESRAGPLENIARRYRECDGEANQDLLQDGFLLVVRLRDDSPDTSTSGASNRSSADELESFLLSELARESFDASMRYVRGMPDRLHRAMSLVRIAESLRESGMN